MFFLLFIITDILHTFFDPQPNVSNLAHIGGGLAGVLVGIGVLRNLRVKSYEVKLWWASVGLFAILMTSGLVLHFIKK
jgi:rhomboid-related protein 1/2/3